MNNRFLTIAPLIASSTLFLAACSEDNSSFETTDSSATPTNAGVVSQKNFSVSPDNPQPGIYDPDTGFTAKTVILTAKIGDRDNNVLTDAHTIYFATEWGLLNPSSCVTEDGKCTVTWDTSSFDEIPADHINTITAWTLGEEYFSDSNDNGVYDDDDLPLPGSSDYFEDQEEPFVDVVKDGGAIDEESGDRIIDVTVVNGVHDTRDTFLNSPNCIHSSACSTTTSIYVWDDVQIFMDVPPPTN